MKPIFLLCLMLSAISCNNTSQKTSPKQEIKVGYVESIQKAHERHYSFLSSPYRITELSFRVGGPVTTFNVQNGQFFKKGELIAAIDDRDFIIRKQRAEALFNRTRADYVRIANLYEKGNISGTSYEKAKAEYEQAKSDFEAASNDLKDTQMTAPFDGYIQQINIDKFQDVNPSFPIITFIDLSKIKAEAYIPEDMAVSLRSHKTKDSSYVRFKAFKNKKFHPIETYVTHSTSDNNISYLYTLILDNKDNRLFGGMAGTLSISTSRTSTFSCPKVSIPQTAVCHNPQIGTYVWLVSPDNRVNKKVIQTGNLIAGNYIEVLSGLTIGDKIALTRLSYLSDNEEIILKL